MKVSVPGMSCNHCRMRIENALKPLPGVEGVNVDIEKKTVEIHGNCDTKTAVKAIEDAGYTVIINE